MLFIVFIIIGWLLCGLLAYNLFVADEPNPVLFMFTIFWVCMMLTTQNAYFNGDEDKFFPKRLTKR